MPRLSHKTILYGAAGGLGGSAAWALVLTVSSAAGGGTLTELMLGVITGMFIGGFIWSYESLRGRQFQAALKRAAYGAAAGVLGGAAGAGLGSTVFNALGAVFADLGGFKASFGVAMSVALGWSVLGAAVGASGGLMVRSSDRALYGLAGGSLGGLFGGIIFNFISATTIWSAFAGLMLLGLCIGGFISLVEEAFVAAKVKVIKGRHVGREFPIIKEISAIGRDDRSDVCLSGAEGVGMRHAFIRRKNGRYFIETGESGNGDGGGTGLYVNHSLTKKSGLSDGDVIRVGSIILMFSAVRKAAAAIVFALVFGYGLLCHTVWAGGGASVTITQFDLGSFPEVKAYVSILDSSGKPVKGITRGDVSLLTENNKPMTIREMRMSGSSGKREPLSLAVVIDKSGSMSGDKIARAKESVLRFISLMEKGDRASLFAFSDEAKELEGLTDSAQDLKKAALSIQPGGHTALYDAIVQGIDSVHGTSGRRAVIVLSDGIANRGTLNIDQAIQSATKAYVSVYVIGLGEDVRTARLERISHETGGSYFFTPSAEGLSEIYETISKRIHNEYIVSYTTEKRAEYLRNVALELRQGRTASRSYFQPGSSLFGAGQSVPKWAFLVPLLSIAGFMAISLRTMERRYKTGHLSLVRGTGSKRELDVVSLVSIGRDERNDLALFKDNGIGQRHAEVRRDNGGYVIEDKGPGAGTYVNQKKIASRQVLADGDIIDIGHARLVFSEEGRLQCPGCGAPMRANAKFCPKCGKKNA